MGGNSVVLPFYRGNPPFSVVWSGTRYMCPKLKHRSWSRALDQPTHGRKVLTQHILHCAQKGFCHMVMVWERVCRGGTQWSKRKLVTGTHDLRTVAGATREGPVLSVDVEPQLWWGERWLVKEVGLRGKQVLLGAVPLLFQCTIKLFYKYTQMEGTKTFVAYYY